MKNAIGTAFLFVVAFVLSSQAVVIHWASSGYDGLTDRTSARLVYVSSGSVTYGISGITNGEEVGDPVTGLALTPVGVARQDSTDAEARGSGAYYVVLFKDGFYAVSDTALAYDNTTAITRDLMAPATGTFQPGGFTGWTPVPEPSAAALLCLGAAAAALRRRKRV